MNIIWVEAQPFEPRDCDGELDKWLSLPRGPWAAPMDFSKYLTQHLYTTEVMRVKK